MKVAFHTLGCKVNIYETEALKELYRADGYEIVDFTEEADVYVINTCSVTAIADKKSRQMIHRARKMNPSAKVVATGCYVSGLSEDERARLGADYIIDNSRKNELLSAVKVTAMQNRTRADVKIEDGCDQFCSYCIIPYRRGRVTSRRREDILDEIKGLTACGHREIVLTGIHLPCYGKDTGDSLISLIRDISGTPGLQRLRLGSLEPNVITTEFMDGLREVGEFCPHFHLSLQSGCDKTLRAMNRHYTTAEFAEKVRLIRSYYPHPAVTTDIIAGFPGETREDFEQSRDFADEMKLFQMHIFPYSRREGTRAAAMPGQLTMAEKQSRVDELEAVDLRNSREYTEYYIGRDADVLMEEATETGAGRFYAGHTDTYVRVAVPAGECDESCMKDIQRYHIDGRLDDHTLIGHPAP